MPFLNGRKYDGVVLYPARFIHVPAIGITYSENSHFHINHFVFGTDVVGFTSDFSLAQVGTVPSDAWELWIYGNGYLYMNNLELRSLRSLPIFGQRAYDIRPFAGQEVNFEIRNYNRQFTDYASGVRIDILGFATPEPSEWALMAFGGGILWWVTRRWRNDRHVKS